MVDANQVAELRRFIEQLKSNPSILHDPSLIFFKEYLRSLGAQVPKIEQTERDYEERAETKPSFSPKHDDDDDDIMESDVELDNSDLVEPDNEPPQPIGDPTAEVTDENRDEAQLQKRKAMEAISDGKFDEAIEHLTKAVILNPTSAILYATRATVFLKVKKPNAAIRDANVALQFNPDSAKGYKSRGMARAMLGQWEDAAADLHVASKLDYDEEIGTMLKKVEPNAKRIEEHRRKYQRLRKEKELQRAERERRQQQEAQEREAQAALNDGQVISIHSTSELEAKRKAAKKASRLLILYFTATWCGPCRYMSPLYSNLATQHQRVVFLKVDIDEANDVAASWNISSVPTFCFIRDGKEVDKVVGADKGSLEQKIAQHSSSK
ncbi:Thioredoxin-like superfamily [Arabidopsis thaliana x Arabidopsis arenosa]|uniref:TPR repeat-containing thioredoxin TDX n=1 Tax=Arabidopsis thaliana x Arabidopsis arenosa TaxID=1240361 RepID=A0A8T2B0N7_9BRAS|nr:Thioredoxin-like superfamily [Arabidopsis thaliana x Arabidopsis arenosa]